LGRRIKRKKRLWWQEALDIIIPTARGLEYAHENGVVHRDIKPANVLLAKSGVPKITDFGIAKVPKADLTQTGVVMGTPAFMSPEQLEGETIDGRSDLFSLTSVLYNLIVGKPPFEADDLTGISHQILYKDPQPPSELVRDIPAPLDGVLARGFCKSPADRYHSAQAFGEDLYAVQKGKSPKLALSPGEKTLAQVPVVAATQVADSAKAENAAPTAFETLDAPRPRKGLRWLVALLMLVAGTFALVSWGPEEVGERARPAWHWLLSTAGAQVEELKTAYEDNVAERERTNAAVLKAEQLLERGVNWESRGHWDKARGAYASSLEIYRGLGDGVREASVLLARGRLEARAGDWSKARADLDAAKAVFRIYEEPEGQVLSLILLGNFARDRGDLRGADSHYEQARQLAGALTSRCPSCKLDYERALQNLLQGNLDGAREGFGKVRRNLGGDGNGLARRTLVYLGVCAFAADAQEMASKYWGEARQACEGSADCLAELRLWEGRAALESGYLDSARQEFETAAEHFRGTEHLPGLASALENLAETMQGADGDAMASSEYRELSGVRMRLGLPELEELRPSSQTSSSGEPSRLTALQSIMRALPRTAVSEQRLASLESLGKSEE
jgi:tetratricopeptide (TPR) repeat protein